MPDPVGDREPTAAEAAVAQYLRRSAEVFQLLTEGYPDPEDGDLHPDDRPALEEVHRTLGRAIERETFPDDPTPRVDAPEGG